MNDWSFIYSIYKIKTGPADAGRTKNKHIKIYKSNDEKDTLENSNFQEVVYSGNNF